MCVPADSASWFPTDERLIISFAPNTLALTILKRIGELFPGPSKASVGQPTPCFHGRLWAAPGCRHYLATVCVPGARLIGFAHVYTLIHAPWREWCRPPAHTCTRKTMWRRRWRAQVGRAVGAMSSSAGRLLHDPALSRFAAPPSPALPPAAGFKVTKREMTSTQFYFSRLLEAKRV